MQLRRFSSTVMLFFAVLSLSSCKKKSVSDRSLWSDTDVFFCKPTVQECKKFHHTGNWIREQSDAVAELISPMVDEKTLHLLLDVPLPVDALPLLNCPDYVAQKELSLKRSTALSPQDLYDFYLGMFEQASWRLLGHSKNSFEIIMVWEKTDILCVVSTTAGCTKKSTDKHQKTLFTLHIFEKY